MKKSIITTFLLSALLVIAPSLSYSKESVLDVFATQSTVDDPSFSVIKNERARKRWMKYYSGANGSFQFFDVKFSKKRPNVGIARMYWTSDDKSVSESGWLLFQTNEKGDKIKSLITTQKPPLLAIKGALGLMKAGDLVHSYGGQLLDVGTTASAITATSLVEANPVLNAVGVWPALAVKVVAPLYMDQKASVSTCVTGMVGLNVSGWFGGVWNLGLMAGIPQAWVAAIPAVGVSALYYFYDKERRSFWSCVPSDIRPVRNRD